MSLDVTESRAIWNFTFLFTIDTLPVYEKHYDVSYVPPLIAGINWLPVRKCLLRVEPVLAGPVPSTHRSTISPNPRSQGQRARPGSTPHPWCPLSCVSSSPARPDSRPGPLCGRGPSPLSRPALPAASQSVSLCFLVFVESNLDSAPQLPAAPGPELCFPGLRTRHTPHDNMTHAGVKAGRTHLEPAERGRRP